jgi:hypothetical protein
VSAERGGYGSVRRVLLDGPDFRRLSAEQRWVFVALKISTGASGIDVAYPEAVVAELVERTGYADQVVRKSLAALKAAGWVAREQNVLWVVGHLEHDPHLRPDDSKHRKAIQRHVAGLPRLNIVAEFVKAHGPWFPKEEALTHGLGWVYEGPTKGHRSTETETEPEPMVPGADAPAKKPRGERPAPRYPGFSKDDCDRLYVVWQRFGSPPYSAFRSALGPLFEGPAPCSADDLELGMREAISRAEADPKEAGYLNIHSFAQKARWWIGEAKGRPLAVNAAGILQVAR